MNRALKYTGAVVATYFVSWTASYILVFLDRGDGLDFRYYFQYLRLAWTFSGQELPTFICLISIALAFSLSLFVVYLLQRYEKRKGQDNKH